MTAYGSCRRLSWPATSAALASMAGKVEHQHLPSRVAHPRDGLVQALAQRTFALLMDRVAAVAPSGDPGRDLIAGSVHGYRAFALDTPTATACSSSPSCHARR